MHFINQMDDFLTPWSEKLPVLARLGTLWFEQLFAMWFVPLMVFKIIRREAFLFPIVLISILVLLPMLTFLSFKRSGQALVYYGLLGSISQAVPIFLITIVWQCSLSTAFLKELLEPTSHSVWSYHHSWLLKTVFWVTLGSLERGIALVYPSGLLLLRW